MEKLTRILRHFLRRARKERGQFGGNDIHSPVWLYFDGYIQALRDVAAVFGVVVEEPRFRGEEENIIGWEE